MNADEIKKALFEASEICRQKVYCKDCPFVKTDGLRCPIHDSWPCYWDVSDWGGVELAKSPVLDKKANKKDWISMNDRLPFSEEEALTYILRGSCDIVRYRDGAWSSEYINKYDNNTVTHRKPLPIPPKETNDD